MSVDIAAAPYIRRPNGSLGGPGPLVDPPHETANLGVPVDDRVGGDIDDATDQ